MGKQTLKPESREGKPLEARGSAVGTTGDCNLLVEAVIKLLSKGWNVRVALPDVSAKRLKDRIEKEIQEKNLERTKIDAGQIQYFDLPDKINTNLANLEKIGLKKSGNPAWLMWMVSKLTRELVKPKFLREYEKFLSGSDVVISSALTQMLDMHVLEKLKRDNLKEKQKKAIALEAENVDANKNKIQKIKDGLMKMPLVENIVNKFNKSKPEENLVENVEYKEPVHVFLATHPVVETNDIMFPVLPFNRKIFWSRNKFVNSITNKLALVMERAAFLPRMIALMKYSGHLSELVISGSEKLFRRENIHVLLAFSDLIHGIDPKWNKGNDSNRIKKVGYPYVSNPDKLPQDLQDRIAEAKESGRNIVLITFGSMSPNDIKDRFKIIQLVEQVCKANPDILFIYQDPSIRNDEEFSEYNKYMPNNLHYTNKFLNYGELMPQCDITISHFGIGSMSEVLRAGSLPVVLAWISEQMWTGNVAKLLGVAGSPHYVKKMTPEKLSKLIRERLNDKELRKKAEEVKKAIRKEIEDNNPAEDRIYDAILELLGDQIAA